MTEPRFLSVENVLDLHATQLKKYGGQEGVRDRGLLESAVAQASATMFGEFLHEDLFHMAAAYAFHIAESQALLDGNKRTALESAFVFLAINGYDLVAPASVLHQLMIDVSARRADKKSVAVVFREHSRPAPDPLTRKR